MLFRVKHGKNSGQSGPTHANAPAGAGTAPPAAGVQFSGRDIRHRWLIKKSKNKAARWYEGTVLRVSSFLSRLFLTD